VAPTGKPCADAARESVKLTEASFRSPVRLLRRDIRQYSAAETPFVALSVKEIPLDQLRSAEWNANVVPASVSTRYGPGCRATSSLLEA
jgi:hypothetical protein